MRLYICLALEFTFGHIGNSWRVFPLDDCRDDYWLINNVWAFILDDKKRCEDEAIIEAYEE